MQNKIIKITHYYIINTEKTRYFLVLRKCFIIITLMFATRVCGQYDVSFSHYFDMQPSFNPAAAGKESKLNINGAYAMQLAGYKRNPQTFYIAADMPVNILQKSHGIGAILMNDQLGLFTHIKFGVQYAFKTKFMGGQLALGVQGGFLNDKFKTKKLDLEDKSDPAFPSADADGTSIDVALGTYYSRDDWYVGAAVQHLNSPTIQIGEKNELSVGSTYYLNAGYNIKLTNPFITIHPSLMVRTDGVDHREDATCRIMYTTDEKKMYLGVGYAYDKSATIYIGGNLKNFNVGYSYEVYTSGIDVENGSHEIFVSYQMDLNGMKKNKNLHKCVRLL